MTDVREDPAADALLDFQTVMVQFLDLQHRVIGAYWTRRSQGLMTAPAMGVAAAEVCAAELPAAEALPVPAPEAAPAQPAAVDAIAIEPPPTAATASRYTLLLRDRPRASTRAGLAAGHVIVVTDDRRGVAGEVAARLRTEGWRVAIVSTVAGKGADLDWFVSPLAALPDVERIAQQIGERCGPVAALVHLIPLAESVPFDALDADSWEAQIAAETGSLFLLSKAFAGSLSGAASSGGAAVIAATALGGTFGVATDDVVSRPSHAGVAGFAKCLALEWPDVRVRCVDLDIDAAAGGIAGHVLDELWASDSAIEVGIRDGRRTTIDVVRTVATPDPDFVLSSEAVVLATGGARGITAEICLELAERYQPTFVLVGQSELPPAVEAPETASLRNPADIKRALIARFESSAGRVTPPMVERAYRQLLKERELRETIGTLSATGARLHYVALDVTDADAFGALIEQIYAVYGRLDGVLHGAGIIEDKLVRDKAPESFARVMRTKTRSAFVLSRHIRPETLRFAVFFSSVAGRFGNRGQADYAAANEVVSKLAALLQRRWAARVCTIAWAPWDKLGMVSPELKREFARRGVELLAPSAGRRALWHEIQQSPQAPAEVVVGGHAATPLTAATSPDRLPLLKTARREAGSDGTRFERVLDPSIDLYLHDHRLDGHPVLPLAFATELMAEAGQAAWPELQVVAVRDLQMLKGLVIDAPLPVVITVRSAVHSNDDGLTEVDVEITTPAATPALRYRAVVQLSAKPLSPAAFEEPAWPLAPLAKTLDRAYRDWTFHGPLFQRVTAIRGICDDAVLGTIYSSSAIRTLAGVDRPGWIIDPFVFDCALQLLLIWSRASADKTALPSRFGRFARYGSLSDQPLTAYVAVESLSGGHALRSDVHFVDAGGRIVGVLSGMEANCTRALNRLGQS